MLAERFPTLRLVSTESNSTIAGLLNLEHDGHYLGGFVIEVRLNERDVLGLPSVREVGGKIPRNADRHINPNGTCCLYLPADLALRYRKPFTAQTFLDGPVRQFFVGQLAFEEQQAFPYGEWPHGDRALGDLLAEQLALGDAAADRRALDLLARKVMKDHWPCPCGSKRALRACHGERLRMLRRRSPQQSWKLLRKAIRDADAIPGPPASPNRV